MGSSPLPGGGSAESRVALLVLPALVAVARRSANWARSSATTLARSLAAAAALGGYLDNRSQQKSAADFNNQMLDLKREQLDMAKQDYAQRAPLRNTAIQRLGAMASGPIGSSIYGKAA
jgi:hypothetical protein